MIMPRDMKEKKKRDQQERDKWERFVIQEGALEKIESSELDNMDNVVWYGEKKKEKE